MRKEDVTSDGDERDGDGHNLRDGHDCDSDECDFHAKKFPSFKEYALSFADSDINDSDSDVDDIL